MSIDDPSSWITLASSRLSASIDPHGAQLVALRDSRGRDLLWSGDPAWWAGRAPVLFPIVGALAAGCYRWRGREYSLPRHGFARHMPFTVQQRTADAVTLVLRANEATRDVYPFAFELELAFATADMELHVVASVRNTGSQQLPASIGFHPAFRWPLDESPREQHWLEFERAEPEPVRRLDNAGLLREAPAPTPVHGRRLALDDSLFAEDVVIFDRLHSRSLSYGSATDRLTVEFPDASHLGLWSKPGARFLCIEPWRGVADPEGGPGELDRKPGVLHVEPGDVARLTMRIRLAS